MILNTKDGGHAVDGDWATRIELVDDEPGLLISPAFWVGLLASIAVWTAIWYGVASFLDALRPTI